MKAPDLPGSAPAAAACSSKAPLNYHTLTSAAEPASQARAADFRLRPAGRLGAAQVISRSGGAAGTRHRPAGKRTLDRAPWPTRCAAPCPPTCRGPRNPGTWRCPARQRRPGAAHQGGPAALRFAARARRPAGRALDPAPGRAGWGSGAHLRQPDQPARRASYDAEVVAAHRQALATLARRIEPLARAFVADGATVCPAG